MNNQYDTLSQAITELQKNGYDLDFNLKGSCIECGASNKTYDPSTFHIDEFHRFEGMSDPDDMSIIYAISTKDGRKGTLVDAYGTYSSELTREMIQKMSIR